MKTSELTAKEQAIWDLLCQSEEPLSARVIYEQVWGERYLFSSQNTVAVHIARLRKKRPQPPIITLWGRGYRMIKED